MAEKIFLSTYSIRIKDKKDGQLRLQNFNEEDDFFDVFIDYCMSIHKEISIKTDKKTGFKQKFTIDNLETDLVEVKDERTIYGYFNVGISGDKFDVGNNETGETEFKVKPNLHTSYKKLFFLLYLPKTKSTGYLILQRKSKFGIKTRFLETIKSYFRDKWKFQYKVSLSNRMPKQIFDNMMKRGDLKQLSFIKESLPGSLQDFLMNRNSPQNNDGILTKSMRAKTKLPDEWKESIFNWYHGITDSRSMIDIPESDTSYDEISYSLNLNGKETTFYVKNKHRIRPDIDVTENLEFGEDNEPTVESLVKESKELIDMVLELKPRNV